MPASAENSSPATATSRSATLSPRAQPPNLLLRTQMKMATPTSSSTPNADIIAVCPVMICQPPVSKQSHYSGANQRARSWSRSGSCHDWENTWITLMPARTWETPCDSLRRSPAETTQTADSCASRRRPDMKTPPFAGASSYLQPRRISGFWVCDGDRLSRALPLYVCAQALGDEAQREHRATVQDLRHDLWVRAVDEHQFAIHQCARLPNDELESGPVEQYGHRLTGSIPGDGSTK